MSGIVDKMRKARESTFDVGSVTLTVRRPTDWDALSMKYSSRQDAILGVAGFIVNWSGVTEQDLFPGGNADPVPFDDDIFAEWLKDKPEHWAAIIDKVKNIYTAHSEKLEDVAKN